MRNTIRVLLCLSLLVLPSFAAEHFAVAKTITLGGDGGWDYLTYDPQGQRIFITRGTHVVVVSANDGKQAGDIPETPGAHGVALAPELSKGFISAGRANKVIVFDLKALKSSGSIGVGDMPDAIVYEPSTQRVFTFNAHSQDATAVDAKTEKVLGTIPLQGKPEFAVADGKGNVFVNIETTAEIVEFDAATLKVAHRWAMKGCEEPTGLAIDTHDSVLFAGCSNKVMTIVNAKDGSVLAQLPIGDRVDGVSFDPGLKLAFSSNGDGTLTIVGRKGKSYEVAQTVSTKRGARTLALDPASHTVYLVTADFDEPPATNPGGRPTPKPGTFSLIVVAPGKD